MGGGKAAPEFMPCFAPAGHPCLKPLPKMLRAVIRDRRTGIRGAEVCLFFDSLELHFYQIIFVRTFDIDDILIAPGRGKTAPELQHHELGVDVMVEKTAKTRRIVATDFETVAFFMSPTAITLHGFDGRDDLVTCLRRGFWFCHRAFPLDDMR